MPYDGGEKCKRFFFLYGTILSCMILMCNILYILLLYNYLYIVLLSFSMLQG